MKRPVVMVLLEQGLDAHRWSLDYGAGRTPDASPYGYHHLGSYGYEVRYSRPTPVPGGLRGAWRRAGRAVRGHDVAHVLNNLDLLTAADVDAIWTHTEIEALALSAVAERRGLDLPPVLAQSVWLADSWARMPEARRRRFQALMRRWSVATFLSPLNRQFVQGLGVGIPTHYVPFGISMDTFPLTEPRIRATGGRPVRVLAMGGDRHRDWRTFHEAFAGRRDVEAFVASRTYRQRPDDSIEARQIGLGEVRARLDWADCVVVPLKENLHASGVTVLLEAAAAGVPVVASRCGGLDDYLSDEAALWVEPGSPQDLYNSVISCAHDPGAAQERAINAQRQMQDRDLTTHGYVGRQVELSRQLLWA